MVRETENAAFSLKSVKRTDKQRTSSPPFTTSTMSAGGLPKLSMTPGGPWSIAQQLLRGRDIAGEGSVGLITYMRTDSLRLSEGPAEARLHPGPHGDALRQNQPLQGQGKRPGRP